MVGVAMASGLIAGYVQAQAPRPPRHRRRYASARADPSDAPPLGPHRARQVHRLPRELHRAPAGLLRQGAVRDAGLQGRYPSVHPLQVGLPAGDGPVLADRGGPVQPDVLATRRAGSARSRSSGLPTSRASPRRDVWPWWRRCSGPAGPSSPDRVVIGPSVYPGTRGVEAANDYQNILTRAQQGPRPTRCLRRPELMEGFSEMKIKIHSR